MLTLNLLLAICLTYVAFLFVVAFLSERAAERGRLTLLRGPWIYTMSLSVYCTAWTFYGAVGYAARSGLEFITIYLGPTLVFVGWWWVLRKLVAIGRAERITSIADMISSRYGKSNGLAVLVTLLAVVGTTPYIALQLQSVTSSFGVFAPGGSSTDLAGSAFWVAVGLAIFTIIFGTRRLDAGERHHGIVGAIAVEAVVKLVALLSVGVFVVWGLAGGPAAVLSAIDASPISDWTAAPGRWAGLIAVSAAAIICLPRMFQVLVVENTDERHLITASWAFPLYLMAMSLFVVPIAVIGLARLPEGSNPDLFVLTLPLSEGRDGLAMLAFLGGFSSATSMVILAAVALATMLSNHIVMPLWLASREPQGAQISGDVRTVILRARRLSILAVLGLGYLYFQVTGGTAALASIGLISFVGMAQVLPALVFGLFWRGATARGAAAGIVTGFALWAWTMLVPVFGAEGSPLMTEGPWGLSWLRPQAMFGISGDPLLSAVIVTLGLNCMAFCAVSLASRPSPMEQLQAPRFVQVFDRAAAPRARAGGRAGADELLIMAQRILGAREAQAIFAAEARAQGRPSDLPQPTPALIERLERELSGSVGAATAHAMVSGITGDSAVSVEDLIAVADETAQVMEYSARLEAREAELTRTARELRETNDKLTLLAQQKDAFLSQVSHELRTPMTSIRAFSEILRGGGLDETEQARYSGIILEESQRLTRLLDDLLDLSVLENGQVELNAARVDLSTVIDRAVMASSSAAAARLQVIRDREAEAIEIVTDADRLAQVFINLVTNAAKYCDAARPELRIEVSQARGELRVDFIDNGAGIAPRDRGLIFEKFARLSDQSSAGSAGLGLAICREVMARLGGGIDYLPGRGGGAFRVRLPLLQVGAPVGDLATVR
ncbi:sensor histidine kinase [Jannaschia seohaensis]|uniref:histidine kinase n=1 Tax=Jannaschia seohaensis TaxID=475081 RepID=A0A2Y9AD29_9RHOB|nr:sensor histidine kinase [Jannaschia seohaensis]PWJ21344.1 hypothetical protein BCF38_102596 [Jannaschia seohaensis]SSA41886.1 hypothetical protein SAMN05421539_102596 [Jannaschia seohaensis]